MRVRAVFPCLVAVLLPHLAQAAAPAGELGALQAVFDFCSKTDPGQKQDFERLGESMFAGLSPDRIARIRKSSEYARGYRMLTSVLPGVNDPIHACRAVSGAHNLPSADPKKSPPERKDLRR